MAGKGVSGLLSQLREALLKAAEVVCVFIVSRFLLPEHSCHSPAPACLSVSLLINSLHASRLLRLSCTFTSKILKHFSSLIEGISTE